MKNTLFALLGFILLSTPLAATAQFTYYSDGSAITITGYTGPGGDVTIPSTIHRLPVTIIGNNAFAHSYSLTSVTIPNSVITIGADAFSFCTSLRSAVIPIVIEAATNLASTTWSPLQSLNLPNGAFYFSDPDWANYPARFYRIRSP